MKSTLLAAALIFMASAAISIDAQNVFKNNVEKALKADGRKLSSVCPTGSDSVADRVFRDYGAVFLSQGTTLPTRCVFDKAGAAAWQSKLDAQTETIGGTSVTLQRPAMKALHAAIDDAKAAGVKITPRGGSSASSRTYEVTETLWDSRFEPGLAHWMRLGKITKTDADAARRMSIHDQVAAVLAWESKGYWFSKDLSKSILYSVAAPGASQHIFMLALDVAEFDNPKVRAVLARHGWFQTVVSDLPHFTYLGRKEGDLPALGLKKAMNAGRVFWVPDI